MYTFKDSGCEVDDGTRGNICVRLNVPGSIRLDMNARGDRRAYYYYSEEFVDFKIKKSELLYR